MVMDGNGWQWVIYHGKAYIVYHGISWYDTMVYYLVVCPVLLLSVPVLGLGHVGRVLGIQPEEKIHRKMLKKIHGP